MRAKLQVFLIVTNIITIKFMQNRWGYQSDCYQEFILAREQLVPGIGRTAFFIKKARPEGNRFDKN
jgi:hypothetical protein